MTLSGRKGAIRCLEELVKGDWEDAVMRESKALLADSRLYSSRRLSRQKLWYTVYLVILVPKYGYFSVSKVSF